MKYCLIGEKLSHSYSAELHRAMGLKYSLVEIERDKLSEFLASSGYDGFNVTIPFKKAVMESLDVLDASAKLSGAVNTVKREGDRLIGYNTDIGGMRYMIERKGVTLSGKCVTILGSGGTANTAKTLATQSGAKKIYVVSRTGEIDYENCYDLTDTEIIINTTPVGMYPDIYRKPIELYKFENLRAVFDCIYNPFTTALLLEAKSLGLTCGDGLPMLVRQAVLAENIWNGTKEDPTLTENLISAMRAKKANLVLYGMPSCGKTTLGKIVAKNCGKPFIDLDEYIAEKYGVAPSDIIRERGEEVFRRMESDAVAEAAATSGKVIALGGGTVLDPENVSKLKMNGVMIYVKRDLSLLTTEGRPLSEAQGVENLFYKRKDIYESVGDTQTENDGDLNKTAKEIEKAYETACNKWR